MASGNNVFTCLPDRNKIEDRKRFARRTTTMRPITFFKNWDSNLSTPDGNKSQTSQPNKLQTSQLKNSFLVADSRKDAADKPPEVLKSTDNNDILNETPGMVIADKDNRTRSPILDLFAKEYNVELDGTRTVTNKLTKSPITDRREQELISRDAVQCEGSDKLDICLVKQTGVDETKSHSNDSNKKVVQDNDDISVNPTDHNNDEDQDRYSVEEDGTGNQTQKGSGQAALVSYLQNAGLHVSVVNNNEEELTGQGNRDDSNSEGVSLKGLADPSTEGGGGGDRAVGLKQGHTKVSVGQVNVREETVTEMEEVDITHKIPLAQSTAIGVEIEQEVDEEEDDDVVNPKSIVQQRRETITDLSTIRKQKGHTALSFTQSVRATPPRTAKRKLVTSTPKADDSTKRKRISITTPVSVQHVNIEVQQQKDTPPKKSVKQVKPKPGKTRKSRSLTVTGSPVTENTPDLRKAMLLSYAKTPSGVTPSYLTKTPKSGPMIRPAKKKTRPALVPVPDDLALSSPQKVEEVDLWQGDIEHKRHLSDTTDLDIILQTFERVAWHYKENIEEPSIRKAVTLFAKKTQADLRSMVSRCQHLKDMKSSYTRSQSIINKKRLQLLNLQKEHSRMKASVASVQLELKGIETAAECQADIQKFKQVMGSVRKEQENTGNTKAKPKVIGAILNKENSGFSGDYLNEAQKIFSKTVRSLKDKHKS